MLREHKRRVVRYIESTIPEDALDMGTSVMVMQTICKTPGCVPLETSVIIVFPKDGQEHIQGLPESCGGTFKTKILLPLSEVTKDDVLDALPPTFKGTSLFPTLPVPGSISNPIFTQFSPTIPIDQFLLACFPPQNTPYLEIFRR